MKKLSSILLILFFSATSFSQTGKLNDIDDIISKVKEKHAPDKRTTIFAVEYNLSGNQLELKGETSVPEAKSDLLKEINASGKYSVKDLIQLLPSPETGDKIYGIINLSVGNLRATPDHPAEMVTQALLGTVVKVYKKAEDSWWYIQTPDDYLGWIDGFGVHRVTKNDADSWIKSEKIVYLNTYGHLLSVRDENSEPVTDLVAGNILKLTGKADGWYSAELPDKRSGFISEKDAMPFNEWIKGAGATEEKILRTAKRFMGVPYLWGGTSSKGFDCSGFTKTVYFLNGLILQRDASQQYYCGQEIKKEEGFGALKKGDLVFFGLPPKPGKKLRASHVGIYIGDSEFIHASGRVMINSFDKSRANYSEFRTSTYIGSRRIIGSEGVKGVERVSESVYYIKD